MFLQGESLNHSAVGGKSWVLAVHLELNALDSCTSTEKLLQSWYLWACLCPVLHFMSLQTPLQSPSQVFTDVPPQEVVTLHCRDQSCWVISKAQESKLSFTILQSVFIPIYSIGTAVVSGVPLWK